MAANDYLKHIRLSPPPLATPLSAESVDQFAMPHQHRTEASPVQADLHPAWSGYFKSLGQRASDLPAVIDTHANRVLATNPAPASSNPPYLPERYLGMFYLEVDRNALYVSRVPQGVVDVAGTAVTWTHGSRFTPSLEGGVLVIDGVNRTVATVTDPENLILTADAGSHLGVLYQGTVPVWQLHWASQFGFLEDRPADLTVTDAGYWYRLIDDGSTLRYVWSGSAWVYIDGEQVGLLADRPDDLTAFDESYLYRATDAVTWRWDGTKWVYFAGEWSGLQAALPADLTADDAGYLARITDYGHRLKWTGTAWEWAPGEPGSGQLQYFAVAPGSGWHACDGSTVAYLKPDGTLGSVVLPDTAGSPAYLKAGAAYAPAVTAAASLAASGDFTFVGDPLPAHAHEVPIASSGNNELRLASYGTGGSRSATAAFTGASSAATGSAEKTQAVSAGTPTGTITAPDFSLGGDPVAHAQALLYFRR